VTEHRTVSSGEIQAKRLEQVSDEVAKLLRDPKVASRLRTSPGENEWSAMQTLGHMTEMIPYWLHHCRVLIESTGDAPTFGRAPGSSERLDGVARGAVAQPDEMLARLQAEVRRAAATIRALSAAERSKRGINPERGEVSVAYVIESFIVDHAEEHLAQVKGTLRV
jgi:uncharacterized damage-inducible protein DinB